MPELLAALDAFLQEHRRCGELDGGVDGERVWMACDCGAGIAHPVNAAALDQPREPRCRLTIGRVARRPGFSYSLRDAIACGAAVSRRTCPARRG